MNVGGSAYLLDTSALLTLIEDESGVDRVEQLLRRETVFVPWLALLEATYVSRQERGADEAQRRYALIRALPATVLWDVSEAVTLQAAGFKAEHRLSLADAIIASFAVFQNATLVHKDPEFEALAGAVKLEALPYK